MIAFQQSHNFKWFFVLERCTEIVLQKNLMLQFTIIRQIIYINVSMQWNSEMISPRNNTGDWNFKVEQCSMRFLQIDIKCVAESRYSNCYFAVVFFFKRSVRFQNNHWSAGWYIFSSASRLKANGNRHITTTIWNIENTRLKKPTPVTNRQERSWIAGWNDHIQWRGRGPDFRKKDRVRLFKMKGDFSECQ